MEPEILPAELDRQVRISFSGLKIRLAPNTKVSDIIDTLQKEHGVAASAADGLLSLRQNDSEASTGRVLRAFAEQHPQFFITEQDDVSKWSTQQKTSFIAKHGVDAFTAKVSQQSNSRAAVGVLDPGMSAQDWKSLTTAEKTAFIREHGDTAVSRIMARR